MKCLPLHPAMLKHLKPGTKLYARSTVVVFSRYTRPTLLAPTQYIVLQGATAIQRDKKEMLGYYICLHDILAFKAFNSKGYIYKYKPFIVRDPHLHPEQLPTREQLRDALADATVEVTEAHHFKEPKGNTKWLAHSNEEGQTTSCLSSVITANSEAGLKAKMALAIAENPALVFDVYQQKGIAKSENKLTFLDI